MDAKHDPVHHHSSPEAKIALFRWLFRGRDDVYPRRFESRGSGKSGYAPACANDGAPGLCEKPKVKCAECPHRRFPFRPGGVPLRAARAVAGNRGTLPPQR